MAGAGASLKSVKDAGEIYGRLFDHRAFLQGEQTYFVKEFEEKRNDREVENLFTILEKVTEIKETELERVQQNGDTYLPSISENIAVAAKLCERICDRCDKTDRVAAEVLQKKRVKRRSDWDVFVVNIQDEKARVDQMFMQKERSLRELYDEREQNLKC